MEPQPSRSAPAPALPPTEEGPAPTDDGPAPALGGRYVTQSLIGRGGMASVWRAQDLVLDRPVAVKRMHARWQDDPELAERFRREAQVVARLSHANLVQLLDRGEDGEGPYLVFELVEGRDLKSILRERGRFAPAEAARICGEVGRALAYAHDRGVVHRDIKAHNVLLADDGRARLTDFGIARVIAAAEQDLTRTGSMIGTADYLAPEQAEGLPVDARTDVYALGVVLYELLTGELPFRGEGFLAVALAHLNRPMPDPRGVVPELPEPLANAVMRACAKQPEDRFPTAAVMADMLEGREPRMPSVAGTPALEALGEDPVTTGSVGYLPSHEATGVLAPPTPAPDLPRQPPPAPPAPPPPAPAAKPPKRRRKGLLIAALVVLALAGGAAIALITGALDGLTGGAEDRPTVTVTVPPAGAVFALQAVDDYDPEGDGDEGGAETTLTYDPAGPTTEWHTERYSSEQFSGLDKDGVGLIVRLREPGEPGELVLWSTTPGGEVEVLGAPGPDGTRPDLAAGRPIAGGRQAIPLQLDEPSQVFVLWITRLPRDPTAGSEMPYRAAVGQVELRGPANP